MRQYVSETNYSHSKSIEELQEQLRNNPIKAVPKSGKHILYEDYINSTWFLEVELHEDDTVTIIRNDRDYMRKTAEMREGYVIEGKGRDVVEVGFRCFLPQYVNKHFYHAVDFIYPVRNIQNVFSYKG